MELCNETVQKITSGTFPATPENALMAISLLRRPDSIEGPESKVRSCLSCSEFCSYISRAIDSFGSECSDLLLSCYPEILYLVNDNAFKEDLCARILLNISRDPFLLVDWRFAQLRVLVSSTNVTEKLGYSLRETVASVKDNFLWVVKLVLLFEGEKLIEFVFENSCPAAFWSSYIDEFVSMRGLLSKKALLHLLNQTIDVAKASDLQEKWNLPGNATQTQRFMELCFSLKQNSAVLLQERLPDIKYFIKLVNSGKFKLYWLSIPFRLLTDHHNINVLRNCVTLFNCINWEYVDVECAFGITKLITGPFLHTASKQLVYYKPSLGPQILKILLKFLRRFPAIVHDFWETVVDIGGNWTLKYHLLLVLGRGGAEGLVKLSLVDSISQLRKMMSTVPCVSEPLKGCIVTAAFKCGVFCFDWVTGNLQNFINFLSIFQTFNYHLSDFEDLKNGLLLVFGCIKQNDPQNLAEIDSVKVASFYSQFWSYQIHTQLQQFVNSELFNFLLLPYCGDLKSFWSYIDVNDTLNCYIVCEFFERFFSHCEVWRDFSSFEDVMERFFNRVFHRNPKIIVEIMEESEQKCKLVSVILFLQLLSSDVSAVLSGNYSSNNIDLRFIRRLLFNTGTEEKVQMSFPDQILEHYKWKALTAVYVSLKKPNYSWLFGDLSVEWENCFRNAQKMLQSAPMFLIDSILKFVSSCSAVLHDSILFDELADLASECVMGSRKCSGKTTRFLAIACSWY